MPQADLDPGFFRDVLDSLGDGVYFVDRHRRITYWNKGAERISGFAAEHVTGRRCADNILCHVDSNGTNLCTQGCPLLATMKDGQFREDTVFLHHADRHRVPVLVRAMPMRDASGVIVGAIEVFSDNSEVFEAQQRITELAQASQHDQLTGVGNRQLAEAKVHSALLEMHAIALHYGVLFIDVDHFKEVNDRYGHAVGDRVLIVVAQTLAVNLRGTDVVARWGGEEFIAVVRVETLGQLQAVAEKLRRLVSASTMEIGGVTIGVTVSIGATLVTDEDSVAAVVARADGLMYRSKGEGRNRTSAE